MQSSAFCNASYECSSSNSFKTTLYPLSPTTDNKYGISKLYKAVVKAHTWNIVKNLSVALMVLAQSNNIYTSKSLNGISFFKFPFDNTENNLFAK